MSNMVKATLLAVVATLHAALGALVAPSDLMKCSYGDRGSLTATCVNANPHYFRTTSYRFDQLDETVRCVHCSLTVIESGTFDLSGNLIKHLVLNDSRVEKINPKGFVGLIFLERLVLSHNRISSIYPGTFAGVKKIKFVDLSHNRLDILSDDGFMELKNLIELNMESNVISTIAKRAFNGLDSIETINLSRNKLTSLNDVFTNMTSLTVLNLQYNEITTLNGDEFANATNLLELNLANNNLTTVVIDIDPRNELRNLFLQHNSIRTPAERFLVGLRSLENLDLSHNLIGNVDTKLWEQLFQLRHLNMSFNRLVEIQTGAFSGLPQMELLNVSHNDIAEVRVTGIFSLHSLHALDLSYNRLVDFDYVGLISRLPRLSYLKLEENKLPCDLEDEMETFFEEDNFKYVLYDNAVGSFKCTDDPGKKSLKENAAMLESPDTEPVGMTGAEVTIVVLVSIVFVCIGFLFYMQYRTYRELAYSTDTRRSVSSANLMSSDALETGGDTYLQE